MKIRVNCPECGQRYELASEFANRRFQCRGCSTEVCVPAVDSETNEVLDGELEIHEASDFDSHVSDDSVWETPASDSEPVTDNPPDPDDIEFDESLIVAAEAELDEDLRVFSRPGSPKPRRSAMSSRSKSRKRKSKVGKTKKGSVDSSGLSPVGRMVGALVAAALASFFAVTKMGPLSLIPNDPVPVDAQEWQTTAIGPTGMSVQFPGAPKKTKLSTPVGKVDAWQYETGGQAWVASYEHVRPAVTVDRSNAHLIHEAVMADIRQRPQVKTILKSEPFARKNGYSYLVIESENYTGGWSRRTAYATTYIVCLGRHAITLSYISKKSGQRAVADQFFATLVGQPRGPAGGRIKKPMFEE